MSRLMHFAGWPVASGLLLALLVLLAFPELRPGPSSAEPAPAETGPPPADAPLSYADAVDRAAPAVVNVYSRKDLPQSRRPQPRQSPFEAPFGPSQREQPQPSLGSGVIVSEDGYLLTNHHVVEGAEEILVVLHDGRDARAELVGTDPESDLAVLKVALDGLTAIDLGEPDQVRVGDVVLAIGNPFGVGQTVTQGIVSATGRNGLGVNTYENFLQTDAAINPGNSGGALVDARGRLLGINTAILDETSYSVGISFAIPADTAIQSMNDIIEHGRVVRGWLGLVDARPLNPVLAQQLGLEHTRGIVVMSVERQGPAHRAGLRPLDVITHIDGEPVGDFHRDRSRVADARPGSELTIRVRRGDEVQEFTAVVGTRPQALRTRT